MMTKMTTKIDGDEGGGGASHGIQRQKKSVAMDVLIYGNVLLMMVVLI